MKTRAEQNRTVALVCGERRYAWAVLFVCCMLLVAIGTGCVYYNLFYNTKRAYEDAENVPLQPDGQRNRSALEAYQTVIEKCQKLIAEHPDSKYVDDALLLMGKCHFKRGEYDEAERALRRLREEYPQSDHVEDSRLYVARSLLAQGERELAIDEFKTLITDNPETRYSAQVLYHLGTNLIRMGNDDEAMTYLEKLAKDHPGTRYRMDADLEIARLYMDRGQYERSLQIFTELGQRKLNQADKIQYYNALSELQSKTGHYEEALQAIAALDDLSLDNNMQATTMLRKGEAYAGLDSIALAVDLYKTVSARFPKSKYSAEAEFYMGEIYRTKLDSLDAAKMHYDEVPRQYPKSEFSGQAIDRSVSISKYKRLQSSLAEGQGEDDASVKFDLAEMQFFQLKDYDKALATYQEVLRNFPNSEVAPKAAYAIGYIYAEMLKDIDKARVAYRKLVDDYPDSQQAKYARTYLENNAPQLESRNK